MGVFDSPSSQLYDSRNNPLIGVNPKHEIALGHIDTRDSQEKFGFSAAVGTGGFTTVWSPGGNWVQLTNPEFLNIVSSSGLDDVGGTGARTARFLVMDSTFSLVTFDVILTGAVPVVSPIKVLAVFRAFILTAGSTRTNQGNITATAAISATIQGQIPLLYGITQQVVAPIPAGNSIILDKISATAIKIASGSAPDLIVRIVLHDNQAGVSPVIHEEPFDTAVQNKLEADELSGLVIRGDSVLEMVAISDKADTIVRGRFTYTLIEDNGDVPVPSFF